MAVNTLSKERLRSLADVHPESGRVLSVFLNLDPSEFASAGARSTAINSVVNEATALVEACTELDHEGHQALREDLERVKTELSRDDLALDGTRGVALYVCGPEDLMEVLQLPHPVRTHASINHLPDLEPLMERSSQENWCVLLVNRRTARVFRGPGQALKETDHIDDEVHRQHEQGGWSQARYQRSVDKEVADHIKHVADVIFTAHKRRPFDHILIGAPEELAHDVENSLHTYVQERVCGRLHVDVEHSSVEEVREKAAAAIEEYRQQRELELLEHLKENLARKTKAAAGLDAVLAALNEARVETLLMQEGLRLTGTVDLETGFLGPEGATSPTGAAMEPTDELVDSVLSKAIEQSAEVFVVREPELLDEHGGIAAVLRF